MDLSDPLQRMYRDCVAAVMNCPIGDYKTLRERKAFLVSRTRAEAEQLGEHVNENWGELVDGSQRSLVHWIRRLVFRGAWLDQRVKEGELDIAFDEGRQTFGYIQPDRGPEMIELAKEPSWRRVAFRR